MPRPTKSVPSYLHHKKSGQAYCIIRRADGASQQVYLGPWESEESRRAYGEVLAGHVPTPKTTAPAQVAPTAGVTVADLARLFTEHARTFYRRPDGTLTKEVDEYQMALRPTLHLFGTMLVSEFGPKCLKAVRGLMVEGYTHPEHGPQATLSRGVINQRIGRLVRIFKWGVGEELLTAPVWQALKAVPGLQANRTEARETESILPVEWETVEKTLPHLNPVVRAMVLLMWHTGMRPGEACSIQRDEIDRTGPIWLYRPGYHKLAYRNKPRVIAIGPQAQTVLAPFIGRQGYLFSPAHATELVRAEQMRTRETKRYPYEDRRRAKRKKATPKRKPGAVYTTSVLDRAIERAAERAGVPHWHPNQLRHSFATRVRAAIGLEAAQVALVPGVQIIPA